MKVTLSFQKIILQPTTLCNLDCTYCYLPHRKWRNNMKVEVATSVANSLKILATNRYQPLPIVWHSGEPLACNKEHFSQLIDTFNELRTGGYIRHYVQTNATLIDEEWCHFLQKNQFMVGVSLDGPEWANANRLDWNGQPAFARIIQGIKLLQKAHISFTVIAVIDRPKLDKAAELYRFFSELGCSTLGISIEEREGVNQHREICDDEAVANFWSEFFQAWRKRPVIRIREFSRILSWMKNVCEPSETEQRSSVNRELHMTVGWNGEVVCLSPELLGSRSSLYDDFVVGNVCREPLHEIIKRVGKAFYVQDFIDGVKACSRSCSYFSYCRGGFASNKFWELGSTNGTETAYCRNSKIRPVDAVLHNL